MGEKDTGVLCSLREVSSSASVLHGAVHTPAWRAA